MIDIFSFAGIVNGTDISCPFSAIVCKAVGFSVMILYSATLSKSYDSNCLSRVFWLLYTDSCHLQQQYCDFFFLNLYPLSDIHQNSQTVFNRNCESVLLGVVLDLSLNVHSVWCWLLIFHIFTWLCGGMFFYPKFT